LEDHTKFDDWNLAQLQKMATGSFFHAGEAHAVFKNQKLIPKKIAQFAHKR